MASNIQLTRQNTLNRVLDDLGQQAEIIKDMLPPICRLTAFAPTSRMRCAAMLSCLMPIRARWCRHA